MMKKTLVLAMAMVLGVTASVYAANPFSDVPAGHWAYDAVNRLAAAGIIDGYGDGNFGGERLMTRYEMAQIVAKAMAKGANVDRLAVEFADELDSLGVRVAALEKKADNVKITGQIRYEYAGRDGDFKKDKGSVAKNRLRTRLFVNGSVNEDWTYTARIQNDQNLANDSGDEDTKLNQAYVTGKLGGFNVMAGKAPVFLANGNLYDDTAEVIQLTYGKNVKISGYWGQITEKDSGYMADKAYGASLSGKIGRLDLAAGYDRFEDLDAGFTKISNNAVWNAGANYNFGDFILGAMYLNSDISDKAVEKGADTDGFVISAAYKGAKAAKQGTWGLCSGKDLQPRLRGAPGREDRRRPHRVPGDGCPERVLRRRAGRQIWLYHGRRRHRGHLSRADPPAAGRPAPHLLPGPRLWGPGGHRRRREIRL